MAAANIPPPPPPPKDDEKIVITGFIPPPPPPPQMIMGVPSNQKTVQLRVPVATTSYQQKKEKENMLDNPLQKLMQSEGLQFNSPVVNQETVDTARQFNQIFGNILQNTNSLNSISNFMGDDYDDDPLARRKKLPSNIFQQFQIPETAVSTKEVTITTPSLSAFLPTTSIDFDPSVYPSIQECINSAPSKAYIKIPAGVYQEFIRIEKEVVLDGEGEVVILGAEISKNCSFSKLTFKCDNNGENGAVIVKENSIVTFQNVAFLTNNVQALTIQDTSVVNLVECTLTSLQCPCAVIKGKTNVAASNTVFDGSQTYGIALSEEASVLLEKCICRRNQKAAISASDKSELILQCCRVELNMNGLEVNTTGKINIQESSISSNSNIGIYINCRCFVTSRKSQFSDNVNGAIVASNTGIFFSFDSFYKNSSTHPLIFLNGKACLSSSGDSFIGNCLSAVAASEEAEVYIENDKADVAGSAIVAMNSEIILKQSEFRACGFGFQFNDCTFDMNSINVGAGVTSISLTNCTGSGTSCVMVGNAENIIKNSQVKFVKSWIQSKQKALSLSDGKPLFEQCVFDNSPVGAEILSGSPTFRLCSFDKNNNHVRITAGMAVFDGCKLSASRQFAFVSKTASLIVSQCEVTENNGAIDASESKVLTDRSVYTNNGLVAIQVKNRTAVNIGVCHFSGHSSTVYAETSSVSISESTFEAANEIHIDIYGSNVKLTSSTFSNTETAISSKDPVMMTIEKASFTNCKEAAITSDTKATIDAKEIQVSDCTTGFRINGKATISNIRFTNTKKPIDGFNDRITQENVVIE